MLGQDGARSEGRFFHRKQFRRMKKSISRQRTIVAKLARQIESRMSTLAHAVKSVVSDVLSKAQRIVTQSQTPKSHGIPKLYSWHAPEVEVIAKGKARTPYEFGVKVGVACTLRGNLIVGARSFPHNPYDGHTLQEQLEQASILSDSTIKAS